MGPRRRSPKGMPAGASRRCRSRRFGPYTIQAAIAAVHAEAPSAGGDRLGRDRRPVRRAAARATPSPVIELNRAVAVAMRDGPAAGLALIDAILDRGELRDYRLAHAARAELCRRLGRTADARASYERALALARQEPERRFLERRLRRASEPERPVSIRSRRSTSRERAEWRPMKYSVSRLSRGTQAARRARPRVPGLRRGFRQSGLLVAAEALQPVADRDDRARPQRQALGHRRPVRRNERTARRLLPDRGAGPERSDPDRREDPPAREGSIEVRPVRQLEP